MQVFHLPAGFFSAEGQGSPGVWGETGGGIRGRGEPPARPRAVFYSLWQWQFLCSVA